jgi:hypothetical protein
MPLAVLLETFLLVSSLKQALLVLMASPPFLEAGSTTTTVNSVFNSQIPSPVLLTLSL